MQKLLFVLIVICTAVACTQSGDPTVVPVKEKDSFRLADAYFYGSTDTNSSVIRHDHVHYNQDQHIDTVYTYYPADARETVVKTFTYNSHGDIATFRVRTPDRGSVIARDMAFSYDSEHRLQQLIFTYSDPAEPFSYTYSFRYNSNQLLGYLVTYEYSGVKVRSVARYYWSVANGALDSIATGWVSEIKDNDTLFSEYNVNVLAKTEIVAAGAIDRSFVLSLSWNLYEEFTVNVLFNIFAEQFMLPDYAVIRGGSYSPTVPYFPGDTILLSKPYDFTAVSYPDKRLKWLSNTVRDPWDGWTMMRMEYEKVN